MRRGGLLIFLTLACLLTSEVATLDDVLHVSQVDVLDSPDGEKDGREGYEEDSAKCQGRELQGGCREERDVRTAAGPSDTKDLHHVRVRFKCAYSDERLGVIVVNERDVGVELALDVQTLSVKSREKE